MTTTSEGRFKMKEIIKKYLEGKASGSEQQQLLDWMGYKDNLTAFIKEKASWREKRPNSIIGKDTEKGLVRFQAHIMNKEFANLIKLKKVRRFYRYAAAIMLLILVGGGSFVVRNMLTEPLYTSVVADNGQISRIVLPDNSEVWLNSGSKLTYSDKYAKSDRNLKLEGQAYFNVSHNASIPLIVQSRDVNVKVLGTKFEVDAYHTSRKTSVILEEGSVEMSLNKYTDNKLILEPGQQVIFDAETNKYSRKNVKVQKYTSWRKGILNLYNCPLSDAIPKLERRYNHKFSVKEELEDYKITLSIEDEELDDVITILRHITGVNINDRNDTIYFE
jgi:transmembrane sensor